MLRRSTYCALGLILVVVVACGPAAPAAPRTQPTEQELMEADRAFARAVAESGLDGWMSFMAEDAARMARPGEPFITGEARIRAADGELLDSPDLQLTWEPTGAHPFRDGDHGVTTGDYRVLHREDGSVVGCGSYVSFWRRGDDGWKVIFDTGAAAPVDDC